MPLTRSSTHSHLFQVSLPNPQTLSHKSSFIPRTYNLWNVLPSSCFPESYKLPSFKSKINKLDLISLSPLSLLLSSLVGALYSHYGLSPTYLTKKKKVQFPPHKIADVLLIDPRLYHQYSSSNENQFSLLKGHAAQHYYQNYLLNCLASDYMFILICT